MISEPLRTAPMPNFPGFIVREDGTLWTFFQRKNSHGQNGGTYRFIGNTARQVAGYVDRDGYTQVTIRNSERVRKAHLHRLVLEAFTGGPPELGMYACHNDGNPCNNALSNLRWDTQKGNLADRKIHGTHLHGETANGALLSNRQVQKVRRMYATRKYTYTDLGEMFGVKRGAIGYMVRCQHYADT